MKKIYLVILLAFSPFFLLAQNDGEVMKNFKKSALGIVTQCQLDEHTWVIATFLDNNHFALDAINDQMEVVWTAELEGYLHYIGKFKNKVIAIASTEYTVTAQYNATYKAYLLNPESGETALEKNIFEAPDDYLTFPYFSRSADGSFFKMAIRRSPIDRRSRVAVAPVAIFTLNKTISNFNHAKELTIIDVNENLDVTHTTKATLTEGILYDLSFNQKGATFCSWITENSLHFEKYDLGKDMPVSINQPFAYKGRVDLNPSDILKTCVSTTNPDVLFSGIYCKVQGGDHELSLFKIDFAHNTKQVSTETFNSEHIKQLEKAFVPINKKVDKPDFGSAGDILVKGIEEKDGKLVVALYGEYTRMYTQPNMMMMMNYHDAILFDVFDMDLKPLSSALFPNHDRDMHPILPGFRINNNVLYVLGDVSSGMRSHTAIYGEYDLNEGQWTKMEPLGKKGIGSPPPAWGKNTLWFSDGFVVPYADANTILVGRWSYSFHLQHITTN